MDQYEFVRTAYRVYGKNISELARMTGHSRNTIKKAIRGEPWGYKERQRQAFPALACYLEIIDGWIQNDKDQAKKQRHTARRVYHRLIEEHGYKGCESTVRRYVQAAKTKFGVESTHAFIPCDPEAGYEAEADWGAANAVIAGRQVGLKFFCMRSKYSGKHFVRFYSCERQQAFFDAHMHAFSFFEGVFPVLIYDNLKSAVQKILQGKNRLEQESFRKFKAYHSFEARFCNPGSGHEKGGVEGLVGFARRNYMVPIPAADSLEQLNQRLLTQCVNFGHHRMAGRDKTVDELYEQEKRFLVPLPAVPFSNIDTWSGKADKFSTVHVDKNRYSVPTEYAGRKLSALIYIERMEIYFGAKKIAVHERVFGNNKWQLDPMHYLDLIHQRPQAFDSARPIRQWRKDWPQCLEKLLECFRQKQGDTKGTKEFISVLMLFKEHAGQDVIAAVEDALLANVSCADAVVHLLHHSASDDCCIEPLFNWPRFAPADVSVYGQIGGGL